MFILLLEVNAYFLLTSKSESYKFSFRRDMKLLDSKCIASEIPGFKYDLRVLVCNFLPNTQDLKLGLRGRLDNFEKKITLIKEINELMTDRSLT